MYVIRRNPFNINKRVKGERVMFEKIENLFWDFKRGFSSFINQFQEEEKGASDMVAVIVLIVVVIAVATVFRTQLTAAVTAVFDKLTGFIGS